jgi:hypothetical protein
VFDKSARWYFPGQDVSTVMNTFTRAAQGQGIMLVPSGPSRWEGRGSEWAMGVSPKMHVMLQPDQQGFWLDVRIMADLGGGAIAIMVISWMFCFPIAIIWLVTANNSFGGRGDEALHNIHHPLQHLTGQPPLPAIGGGGGHPGWR